HIVAANHGGNRPAIIDGGKDVRRTGGGEMIAVHKVSMLAACNPVKKRMRPVKLQFVPSHMRYFEGGIGRLQRDDVALDPAQSLGLAMLKALSRHQLHADADAEKRSALRDDSFPQGIDHAINGGKPLAAGAKCPDARQHDPVRGDDLFGAACHQDGSIPTALPARPLECLGGGAKVSRPVVNDRCLHSRHISPPREGGILRYRLPPSVPLVEGMASARRGSISMASRRARASALKQLSMI